MMNNFRGGGVSHAVTLAEEGGCRKTKSKLTVDEVFTRWTASMLPLYKPSTRQFITSTVAQLRRNLGKTTLADVTTEMLQAYVASVPVTLSSCG